MSDDKSVTSELRDAIFLIGLSRPKKRNAFDREMLRALADAYTTFERTPEARCAVLFAEGDHFTAGLDLADVAPAVAAGERLFPEEGIDPLGLFGNVRTKPVVCAVQGWCITLGIELLLACDIRVAAKNTRFRQMEVLRGIMPFGGATVRFPRVAGWGNAMRYLLTGDEFDATEAKRMGLVEYLVDTGEQLDLALKLAGSVARAAPLAVQATLRSARLAQDEGISVALPQLMGEVRRLMASEDAGEGMRAFVERREAKFSGS